MTNDTITISRAAWEESLEINQRLHAIQRRITNGTLQALRLLVDDVADGEQRRGLLLIIDGQRTILATLDAMAFSRIVKDF